jgi:hypothetical protein
MTPHDLSRALREHVEQLGRVSGAAERDNLRDTLRGIAPIVCGRGARLDRVAAQINDGEPPEYVDTLRGIAAVPVSRPQERPSRRQTHADNLNVEHARGDGVRCFVPRNEPRNVAGAA